MIAEGLSGAAGGLSGVLLSLRLFLPHLQSLDAAQHAGIGPTLWWNASLLLRCVAAVISSVAFMGLTLSIVGGLLLRRSWSEELEDELRRELKRVPWGSRYLMRIMHRVARKR
ncbi:unnamed protein product [marine sediment metagenome]|uniref:Uncharacterized protein n=1 Tax=marine sediment metagenome TaxID=412755 RepID=X0SFK0_9ZZZZ